MSPSTVRPLVAALALAVAAPAYAQSGSAAVNTQTSVYLAGGNSYTFAPVGGGGLTPTAINLTAGTGRVLRVDASGTATFCPGATCGTAGPDGPSIASTNINASGRISGITAPTSGFLAAVFLGPSLPASAPAALDFNILTTDFTSLSPLIGQVFFVGNGFTAGSVQQSFFVPDGATTLYFGIADGNAFQGDPGFYDDNVGTYTARYSVTAAVVPEPSTLLLLGGGIVGLAVARRRRL